MSFLSILLIAIGLAMDSFAVAITQGICAKRLRARQVLLLAVLFGAFQGLMPLIGYAIGLSFADIIKEIDHWVAFLILSAIGGKMLIEAIRESRAGEKDVENCNCEDQKRFSIKNLTILAIATSIDALATGLIFVPFPEVILSAVLTIGITSFLLSLFGVVMGNKVGKRFNFNFEIVGGIVLILIGIKILFEHLS